MASHGVVRVTDPNLYAHNIVSDRHPKCDGFVI